MLTAKDCRKILGDGVSLTDERLERLRDEMYAMADVVTDHLATAAPARPGGCEPASFDTALALFPDEEREDVAERAAIMQFEGGVLPDEAERAAVLTAVRGKKDHGRKR
jgi:hypothetical protein